MIATLEPLAHTATDSISLCVSVCVSVCRRLCTAAPTNALHRTNSRLDMHRDDDDEDDDDVADAENAGWADQIASWTRDSSYKQNIDLTLS